MVGKYVDLTESYKSLNEALYHGGFAHKTRVHIEYLDSETLENAESLSGVDGILVPHGFGSRGSDGKIFAIQHAREQRIPYFGICYGMQLAVIEYARNVAKLAGANSREIDDATPHPLRVPVPSVAAPARSSRSSSGSVAIVRGRPRRSRSREAVPLRDDD